MGLKTIASFMNIYEMVRGILIIIPSLLWNAYTAANYYVHFFFSEKETPISLI